MEIELDKHTIVIPTYNERENIYLPDQLAALDCYDVVIGSRYQRGASKFSRAEIFKAMQTVVRLGWERLGNR